jgi:hypothetical protein
MQNMFLIVENISERRRVKARLRQLGVKVIHDSGARLMVVDAPEDEKLLDDLLPSGTQLLSPDKAPTELVRNGDEHEMLFARALKLRHSKRYRELKAAQVPGESPEEKEIFSATCMEES